MYVCMCVYIYIHTYYIICDHVMSVYLILLCRNIPRRIITTYIVFECLVFSSLLLSGLSKISLAPSRDNQYPYAYGKCLSDHM